MSDGAKIFLVATITILAVATPLGIYAYKQKKKGAGGTKPSGGAGLTDGSGGVTVVGKFEEFNEPQIVSTSPAKNPVTVNEKGTKLNVSRADEAEKAKIEAMPIAELVNYRPANLKLINTNQVVDVNNPTFILRKLKPDEIKAFTLAQKTRKITSR